MKKLLLSLIFFVLACAMIPSRSVSVKPADAKGEIIDATSTFATKVALLPVLRPICSCESTGRPDQEPQQYDANGNVLHGKINPNDTGQCQLSKTFWLSKATELGYDIDTPQGNIKMANYIYSQNGVEPWKWSQSCWDTSVKKIQNARNIP